MLLCHFCTFVESPFSTAHRQNARKVLTPPQHLLPLCHAAVVEDRAFVDAGGTPHDDHGGDRSECEGSRELGGGGEGDEVDGTQRFAGKEGQRGLQER